MFSKLLQIKLTDKYLFLLSCVILITIKYIQFPSLTTNAEMFAENATNFFIYAYNLDFFHAIVLPDAGYLPLTQRLISLSLVKIFHLVEFYPFVSQFIAIVCISVFASLINFNTFKTLHALSSVRFILGLSIGLISDYELNAFINFIYYGALLLFFSIFINKEKLSKFKIVLLSLVASIIILSKGQLVVFVPIFLFMAILHFRKKDYKSVFYYGFSVLSGLIQLGIMYSNLPQAESSQRLLFIPYYIVKTIYYYILTYRHVFLGYVTKEDVGFLGLGILLVLFVLAFRRILTNKNKHTLHIFIAGNFIALCSLFLTVYVINNNVHPKVREIAAKVTNSEHAYEQPKAIVLKEQKNNEEETTKESIFYVKHFANLRSLFISNLLIFLTGTLVLLSIFPKRYQKLLFLLALIYTSGAFGQIKVEEVYASKNQSYSQWGKFYVLLNNSQYCIPVNHYPALLKRNCDYLYYKQPDNLHSYDKPITSVQLNKLDSKIEAWKIQAVIIINKPNQFSNNDQLELQAIDNKGKVIAKAKQLVPTNYEFIYYRFDQPVRSATKLVWKGENDKNILIVPNLIVLGEYLEGHENEHIFNQ